MARLPRPLARALEDLLAYHWPEIEQKNWNPARVAAFFNVQKFPPLAGHELTASRIRQAALAIAKSFPKKKRKPAGQPPRLLDDEFRALREAILHREPVDTPTALEYLAKYCAKLYADSRALKSRLADAEASALEAVRRVEALETALGEPPAA